MYLHGEYTEPPWRHRPTPLVLAEFSGHDPRLQRLADAGAPRTRVVRAIGAVILLLAAIVYQGSGEERQLFEMTTQWWGILGLIGWAYLVGSLVYTLGHREPAALMGAMALLFCVRLAARV